MKFPFALGGGVAASARDVLLHAASGAAGRRPVPCSAEDAESIGLAYCSTAIWRRSRHGVRAPHRSGHPRSP